MANAETAKDVNLHLLDLPYEILTRVYHFLEVTDALNLSRTCKFLKYHTGLFKAIFSVPFCEDEIPDERDAAFLFNRACLTHPRKFNALARCVNEETGPYMKHLILSNLIPKDYVTKLFAHCSNLDSLDITSWGDSLRSLYDDVLVANFDDDEHTPKDYIYWVVNRDRRDSLEFQQRAKSGSFSKLGWECPHKDTETEFWGKPQDTFAASISYPCYGWNMLLQHGLNLLRPLKALKVQPLTGPFH